MHVEVRTTVHRVNDDLLSAGLGLAGLRALTPPAVANPESPTAEELRRRALWTNWRGIADLSPAGGYGLVYGGVPAVPGREFQALVRLPTASSSHRVMLQVPDAFDAGSRCLLVTASSGSRGIYGAIAVAGAWGLPRGCAVVYTDKGAGTDLYDAASGEGTALDGRLTTDPQAMAFHADAVAETNNGIGYKHANSGDNPEAEWGNHLRQAAMFGLDQLNQALPAQAPFTTANTRIIAVGLSNGGGAVLRAAEREQRQLDGGGLDVTGLDESWLDGVVAAAPNVLPGEGGRALYDYSTDAALWMTCAQSSPELADAPLPLAVPVVAAQRQAACAVLLDAGLVSSAESAPEEALAHLRSGGWTDAALRAGMLSTTFDLWRSVGVTYAASYTRQGLKTMPCGFGFAMTDAAGAPRASTRAERALWWSDGSGIAPGSGVQIVHGGEGANPFDQLRCLRALWTDKDTESQALQQNVKATRAGLPREGLPILVIHGVDDGLVPEAFSGGAYVRWVRRSATRPLAYWRIHDAQHFDAFLGVPTIGSRYVPLLPYVYAGLDALWAQLEGGSALGDAEVRPAKRGMQGADVAALTAEGLRLPSH